LIILPLDVVEDIGIFVGVMGAGVGAVILGGGGILGNCLLSIAGSLVVGNEDIY
jgi:hypothetical protein